MGESNRVKQLQEEPGREKDAYIGKVLMGFDSNTIFAPRYDRYDAWQMEEQIKAKGLDWQVRYIHALEAVLSPVDEWKLIHATPAQRAEACYQMLKQRGE